MPQTRIVLTGISPALRGLNWESRSSLRIGRHDNSDIVLHDNTVSREHAEVCTLSDQWVLRDLARNDRQPTLVNGLPIGSRDWPLKLNDELQCGNLMLQITVLEAPPTPSLEVSPNPPGSRLKTTGSFVRVEAASRNSWEQALEVMAQTRLTNDAQRDHLLMLLRAGHHMRHIGSLDELLESVLADAVAALKAQRGSILLEQPVTGELQLRTVLAPKLKAHQKRCYSRTMAERCFSAGESVLCQDVSTEAELFSAQSVQVGTMASLVCALLRSPRKRLGVLQLDRGPLQPAFTEQDFYLADAIAASVAIGIESAQLVEEQREQFVQTVTSLARAVEVRDYYTANHTRRVTEYALLLAGQLQVTPAELSQIQVGTPLHDIGKIGVDDAILRKPGRLTPDEYEAMKLHTVKGAEILESIHALKPVIPIVRHHHERWDGGGYPDGLDHNCIARTARIVAVADAFDAMTSDRPYRKSMTADFAFNELTQKAGSHFDPSCVQAFLRVRASVTQVMQQQK